MHLNKVVLLFVFGGLSSLMYGQGSTQKGDSLLTENLDEVVVTATRTLRQLSSVPLPVTLISKKQLQKTGVIRLDEILNEQTGIITVADESGFSGVQIQGISADYVMVLLNGVPLVGRSSGNFDLSRLTVGNIKQIEVVKGPSSSLYGSEALGGVINIITEEPKTEKIQGSVSYRFASFNTHDANLNLRQKNGSLGYSLFVNSLNSDGYDLFPEVAGQTVEAFNNQTANAQIFYDFNDKLRLFTSGRFYQQDQNASLVVSEELFQGSTGTQEGNLHLRLDHKAVGKLALEYEIYYTRFKANELLASPVSTEILNESDFDQTLLRPEIRGTYTLKDNNKITLGAGLNHERLDRTFFDGQVRFDAQYAFAQYDFYPFESVNLILGARFDNHSEYQSQFSPKASANWRLSDAFSLKASMGYGFKAPDFRQLYFDFTNSAVGYTVLGYNVAVEKVQTLDAQGQLIDTLIPLSELDEPLAAESSVGYNLGIAYKAKTLRANLNLFRNDFTNLIDTRPLPG